MPLKKLVPGQLPWMVVVEYDGMTDVEFYESEAEALVAGDMASYEEGSAAYVVKIVGRS